MTTIGGAYLYFCDDNGLKRVGATPEEHIENLDRMAAAIAKQREVFYRQVKSRCPQCGSLKPENGK